MDERQALTGWGRTAPSVARVVPAGADAELQETLGGADDRGVVARGLGRSYGDAAQNGGGLVLDMTHRHRVVSVAEDSGLVTVEAGASLDSLMRMLLPRGLFVPVTPGTRQVTVGGAVAADIHGKNHHVDGSFAQHVQSLDLLTADGSIRTLTPQDDLFWATAGGMGLTGIILRATVRMKQVDSAYCLVDTERATDLEDVLTRMAEGDHRYTYSVAWIDCLARGASLGRSVLTRARPAPRSSLPPRLRTDPLAFRPGPPVPTPPRVPGGLLNRATITAFNSLWYHKAPRERREEVQGFAAFFHPLDGVAGWNRLYGPGGFLQYQLVLPFGAEDALRRCVGLLSQSGHGSFLAVLKRFGAASPGHLSFPMPGWTLALDLALTPDLGRLLDRLDQEVVPAGGRLYLAKDSRVPAALLPSMYPRLQEWRTIRSTVDPRGVFTSDLARRLDL